MAGRSNKGSMRLLDLRGQVWWFKRAIPATCRPAFAGVTTYLRSLETSDVRDAKMRRDALEAETSRMFADARAGRLPMPGATLSPAARGALWRDALRDIEASGDDEALALARSVEEDEREALRGPARVAYEAARLGRVPVSEHVEAYISAAKLAPKTKHARRGHINHFSRWCVSEGLTLDKVNRRVAGRYVAQVIDPMHPKTAAEHLLALRQYWIFLHARGFIEDGDDKGGPWVGQQMRDRSRRVERGGKGEPERPFTADEVKALLRSSPPPGMTRDHFPSVIDALSISLLSGMRLEEIVTLWVGEVHDGVFDIQQGKTQGAARRVPIHPALSEIVSRRTAGKGPKDWLFDELRMERDASDTLGKRFRRYRLRVGVADKRDGKRRSLVNFHSARRWFITSARHAGQPRETIGDVVGHRPDKRDITFGVYTPGASEAQWRACVEAVHLPPRVPVSGSVSS